MNIPEKINFRQTRDFTEVFNVSVKFMRQNFGAFFRSIVLVAGPFVLFSSVAAGYYQANAISFSSVTTVGSFDFLSRFGWTAGIFFLASIISNLVVIGTVFSFMICYNEKGPGNVLVSDVSSKLFKNFGRIIVTFLSFLLLMLPLVAIAVGLGFAFVSAGTGMIFLYVLILFFCLLIIMPPLFWFSTSVYLSVLNDDVGPFTAFRKVSKVMRGNFWWTWVIVFCALLLIGIISFVFSLPQVIYQFVLTFSAIKGGGGEVSTAFIIVTAICTFFTTVVHSTLHIISGFHYYSLVEEKDGKGLLERIDEIGNTQINNVEQQY